MKILVACEESQRVCIAFRKYGHEAYSCDLEPCSGKHWDWHIWNDVRPLLNGHCTFRTCDGKMHEVERWDMIIAFPPCTFLTKAGASSLYRNGDICQERYAKGLSAADFFFSILNADCDRIVIENPTPMKIYGIPDPTQVVEPYYFGVPVSKKTFLWIKGVKFLCPTNVVDPIYTFETFPLWKNSYGKYRQKNRSKTFPEVAEAMALSWGVNDQSEGAARTTGVMFEGQS